MLEIQPNSLLKELDSKFIPHEAVIVSVPELKIRGANPFNQ